MKKISIIFLFFSIYLLAFTVLVANNEITYFNGGLHNLKLKFYSSILTGIGAKSRNYGNSITSLLDSPSLTNTNPAGLGFYNKNWVAVDFAPGFSLGIDKLYSGFYQQIDDAVDDAIEDMKAPGMEPIYPEVNSSIGQIGWVKGIAASFSHENFGTWGIAIHKPLQLEMDFTGNGISVIVTDSVLKNAGQPDEYVERTTVPLDIELFSDFNLEFSQVDFGFGRKFRDNLSLGFGLNFLNADINANLVAKINGIIRQTGGNTDINVAFNDPNVQYRNTLNDTVNIGFKKTLFGGKLAISYKPKEWLFLDAVFSLPKKANLDGNLHIVQHTLYALNLNYDEEAGEELFDIELLKPSKIAYTNRTIYDSDSLELTLPGSFGISVGYSKNRFKAILSYEKPIGDLSIHYICNVYEDGMKKEGNEFISYSDTTREDYTIGLKMKHNIKFAVIYGIFALSGQVIIADQILEGVKDADGNPTEPMKNMILGSAAFGIGFRLSQQIDLDMNIIALPSPFLRTTLTYKF